VVRNSAAVPVRSGSRKSTAARAESRSVLSFADHRAPCPKYAPFRRWDRPSPSASLASWFFPRLLVPENQRFGLLQPSNEAAEGPVFSACARSRAGTFSLSQESRLHAQKNYIQGLRP